MPSPVAPVDGAVVNFVGTAPTTPPYVTTRVLDGNTTNFASGPYATGWYLVIWTGGAFTENMTGNGWTCGTQQVTDSAGHTVLSAEPTGSGYTTQIAAEAAMANNAVWFLQASSNPIGVWLNDNPYTDNSQGSPPNQMGLLYAPAPVVTVSYHDYSTPCGNSTTGNGLSWPSLPNATSYNVYRTTTSGSGYQLLTTTTGTSIMDSNPPTLSPYYVVTAVYGGLESALSNQVNGIPRTTSLTIAPDVTTDNTTWFNSGADIAGGVYRCCYTNGAYQYDQRGYAAGRGYTVNGLTGIVNPAYKGLAAGFYLTDGQTNIVAAPGNQTLYPDQTSCETGNANQNVLYNHLGGPLGIFLSDFPLWDNSPGTAPPSFCISPIPGCAITFTATPTGPNIQGMGVLLTWSVAGSPVSVSISGGIGSVAASGSTTVYPTATSSYTLTAVTSTPPAITTTASITALVGFPTQVTNVVAKPNCNGSLTLTWPASLFNSDYLVERSILAQESWTTLATQSGLSYTDSSATIGVNYVYRIVATDGLNYAAPSAEVPCSPGFIPSAPTGLVATPLNQRVQLYCTVIPGATSYSVYRGYASGAETLLVSGLPSAAYTDYGLTDGQTLFYTMTASTACGESAQGAEVSATPLSSLQSYQAVPTPQNYWG